MAHGALRSLMPRTNHSRSKAWCFTSFNENEPKYDTAKLEYLCARQQIARTSKALFIVNRVNIFRVYKKLSQTLILRELKERLKKIYVIAQRMATLKSLELTPDLLTEIMHLRWFCLKLRKVTLYPLRSNIQACLSVTRLLLNRLELLI